MEFTSKPMQRQGAAAWAYHQAAMRAVKAYLPDVVEYIDRMIQDYSYEYIVPLCAWMLDEGDYWQVNDVGTGFGYLPWTMLLAGFGAAASNPPRDCRPEYDTYPFPFFKVNLLDPASADVPFPRGNRVLFTFTEVLEHVTQNPLLGLLGLLGGHGYEQRPEYVFFSTPLAGDRQGCPGLSHWSAWPEWDGSFSGDPGHVSGWSPETLSDLLVALRYEPIMVDAVRTKVVDGHRCVALGRRV
jgi:hypothetical protein